MKTNIFIITILISILSLTFINCSSKSNVKKDGKTIVVGVAYSATYPELFKHAVQPQLEKLGYKVVLEQVNNSNILNESLIKKDIDVHLVGHKAWMEFAAERDNLDISMLIPVPSSVYGIHTTTLKARNLEELKKELKQGDIVAIPNDPSNFSRGLVFLENVGLIKLKEGVNKYYSTEKDIAGNPYGLVLKPVDSAQSARVLNSVAISLIFGTEAYNANVIDSRIVREIITDERFLVGFVVRTEDLNTKWAKAIIEAVHSEGFKDAVESDKYIFHDFQRPEWYVEKWGIKNDSIN